MDLLSRKAVFLDCGHTTHLYFRGGILFGIRKETMKHLIVLQRYYTREHHRSEPNQTWVSQQRSNRLPGFFHALQSPAERTARRPPPGTEDTSSPGTTSRYTNDKPACGRFDRDRSVRRSATDPCGGARRDRPERHSSQPDNSFHQLSRTSTARARRLTTRVG